MNNKHIKTLEAIFALPATTDLPWADIEALLMAIGATRKEGAGSRVKFEYQGIPIYFHRPHKPKAARAYQVELAREFLDKVGIRP